MRSQQITQPTTRTAARTDPDRTTSDRTTSDRTGQARATEDAAPAGGTTDATMTIGELSAASGLSVSAIRFYQRRGVLPGRQAEGWQRFGVETLHRLAVIELAKSAGFALDEVIRIMDALDADPDSVPESTPIWHGLAEVKLADIDARIARLQQMRQLLGEALRLGYLAPERAAQVPALLGWTTR